MPGCISAFPFDWSDFPGFSGWPAGLLFPFLWPDVSESPVVGRHFAGRSYSR